MSALRVQLAIQGGGAKLCALLAAAEVLQQKEKEGELVVTRLAGTSAGALTACLLAAERDVAGVRKLLQAIGPNYLRRIRPPFGDLRRYWRIIRGRPLYLEKEFQAFLKELFGAEKLRSLKKQVPSRSRSEQPVPAPGLLERYRRSKSPARSHRDSDH